jgi:hypothetical protein
MVPPWVTTAPSNTVPREPVSMRAARRTITGPFGAGRAAGRPGAGPRRGGACANAGAAVRRASIGASHAERTGCES